MMTSAECREILYHLLNHEKSRFTYIERSDINPLKRLTIVKLSSVHDLECEGWDGPCLKRNASLIRMHTFYNDEISNYRILCPLCEKSCFDHWDEMWDEYYSGLL